VSVHLILKGGQTPDGIADIYIEGGRIASIEYREDSAQPSREEQITRELRDRTHSSEKTIPESEVESGPHGSIPSQSDVREIDCRGKIVLPGFIDPHVHMRDMNLARKESFFSGSCAALAGGVTSFIDMPNSSPAADTAEGLLRKKEAARASLVNYGFYVGVAPGRITALAAILAERHKYNIGVVKIFFAASSANEVLSSDDEIEAVLSICASHNVPCVAHCELQSMIMSPAGLTAADHHRVRPAEAAAAALRQIIPLQRKTGVRLSIAHVSTAAELDLIRRAKREGQAVYCEATPHHLFLNADECKKSGNFAKINPPLRDERDRAAMLEALCDTTVDYIGTDHSPHTLEEKSLDYENAPSGFPGLETGSHHLIDFALQNSLPLGRLSRLLSGNAAELFGLDGRGSLKKNAIADLVIIDPKLIYTVQPDNFYSKAHYSPFSGRTLSGRVVMTIVNGVPLFEEGRMIAADTQTHKGAELFNAETGVYPPPA